MFEGIKKVNIKSLPNDIISGIIIALVSIPISMGYAQIAGLPAVYGLYGSVLPPIFFALFTSSPQYIFGVDAAPAALTGGVLASMGILSESADAKNIVPVITLFTGLWLLIFYIFKAGRLTQYVSTPVMGGFISGICATIILMQIPKLFGGKAGTGELYELLKHIVSEGKSNFNFSALILGAGCLALILVCKKVLPKFPMPVVVMILAAGIQYGTHFATNANIATLSAVTKGLGSISFPDLSSIPITQGIRASIPIAVVIMAETLLAENNFATKNNYKINDNNEVLTFSICMFVASLIGCCPVNGSVSRTSMNEQFGGKSQLVSIVSAFTMIGILLFATDFIQYLPVPVLTAIVISALLGAMEFDLVKKLHKINKKELWIFVAAFFGVLIFGTIYGVIIGVLLSFVNVVIRESDPPRAILGVVPGRGGFFDVTTNPTARPVENVVIYRFRSNLFFANVKVFKDDIENSVMPNINCIIVDASGIGSIDTTAADTIQSIYESLKKQGIRFYLTEHSSHLNEDMRKLGIGYIIEEGGVRRTISAALRAQGIKKPYPLVLRENEVYTQTANFQEQLLREFEWAFGENAQNQIELYTKQILKHVSSTNLNNEIIATQANLWDGLGSFDEDVLLESLELHLDELSQKTGIDEDRLGEMIEERRERIYQFVKKTDEEAFNKLRTRRHKKMHRLKEQSPELYAHLAEYHEAIVEKRKKDNSKISK